MSSILQGLGLSLAGILITFVYFGLMMLVMVLLREIFKVPPQEMRPDEQEAAQDDERMKAAAIAVAVAMIKSRQEKDENLGKVLETSPGRWWKGAGDKGL